jgi:hypothetical protein
MVSKIHGKHGHPMTEKYLFSAMNSLFCQKPCFFIFYKIFAFTCSNDFDNYIFFNFITAISIMNSPPSMRTKLVSVTVLFSSVPGGAFFAVVSAALLEEWQEEKN